MANKTLFQTLMGRLVPPADIRNDAGGAAYTRDPREALAQLVMTGTMNNTFYATAEAQFAQLAELAAKVDADYLARLAVFARQHGRMKDTPALLVALLATRDTERFLQTAPRVIDNLKMLRNLVQILRSGAAGRKSLGSAPKRFVQRWLEGRAAADLFLADVGASPSLADLIRMAHPRPADAARSAFYAYTLGEPHDAALLPEITRAFEAFKADPAGAAPEVPFQLLTALPLTTAHWSAIALRSGWTTTRMNLNTFARHGVFDPLRNPDAARATREVAARLADPALVRKAGAYPFQLLAAVRAAGDAVPVVIADALRAAMEAAVANVPALGMDVVVAPDVSGSMHSPVTGVRKGATTAVRCIDAAALITAAVLRRNPRTLVVPFSDRADVLALDADAGILANAETLAALPSGGTDCATPVALLNRQGRRADLVVLVSDNESWAGFQNARAGTGLAREWSAFKARNPRARLVCLDLQPNPAVQARTQPDVMNIGGFSDAVFDLVELFARGELGGDAWVQAIESVPLDARRPATAGV